MAARPKQAVRLSAEALFLLAILAYSTFQASYAMLEGQWFARRNDKIKKSSCTVSQAMQAGTKALRAE